MKLVFDSEGFYAESRINTTIPKEKLIEKLQTVRQKQKLYREIDNIEEILYHHILRTNDHPAYREELHIIEVKLHEPKFVKPVAETLHLLIPYRKCVIFSSGQKYLLFIDTPNMEVSQYDYTYWQYLEEILFEDTEISIEIPDIADEDTVSLSSVQAEIYSAFSGHLANSSYACLRRIIDLFKIREERDGKRILNAAINELVEYDQVEYFNDNPFIVISHADQQYAKRNTQLFSFSTLEDYRFGIDRQFELLSKDELTTPAEAAELLQNAIEANEGMGFSSPEDSFDDNEWSDNGTYDEYEVRKSRDSYYYETAYYDSMVREYNGNRPSRSYAPCSEEDDYD